MHPVEEQLYNTLRQHYFWANMQKDIQTFVRTCPNYQKGKRGIKDYGKIPFKDIKQYP